MTKYQEYFQRMVADHQAVFDSFQVVHDRYVLDPDQWQEELNKQGEKIQKIIHEYESKLCRGSEKGGYSQFTPQLAEKFQQEVKKHFPKIDHIGIIVKKEPAFVLRKINLN